MRLVWAAGVILGAATLAGAAGTRAAPDQPALPPFGGLLDEHPAIQYAHRPTRDRVAALNESIAHGGASMVFREKGGYLRAVLEALGVPEESQLLVFSKSGIQSAVTDPRNPRAIFFDDAVVVGYVPGAPVIELAAHDPEQGVVFYTIDQAPAPKPLLTRRTGCLTCHVSSATLEVPGMLVRSTFPAADGSLMPQLGTETVNHRTPILDRWGGWYVTGTYFAPPYGLIGHRGDVTASVHAASGALITSTEVFTRWLDSEPEARGYPSRDSDIAALMVFDHQMHAINLLTRLNWEARVAALNGGVDFSAGALRALVDELTDYLLFVDEVAPPARITPRPGFAERFTAAGPSDRQGRSFRQLDLDTRLLRYPCSYMVHAQAFDHLPRAAREAVYERMWSILSGRDARAQYSHLSAADRRAIVEILRDTKTDLPEFFR
jgi:hypothetical protein